MAVYRKIMQIVVVDKAWHGFLWRLAFFHDMITGVQFGV